MSNQLEQEFYNDKINEYTNLLNDLKERRNSCVDDFIKQQIINDIKHYEFTLIILKKYISSCCNKIA